MQRVREVVAVVGLGVLLTAPVVAGNWPAWRGPTGQGVTNETELPLEWTTEKNVRWKVPLPAGGNSTPIVWGDRVFVTQATDEGAERATLCFARMDGGLLWRAGVIYAASEPSHKDNPYCSASPVTDGEHVVASYGSAGVYCYDLGGNEKWHRQFGDQHHIWGNASSPVLHDGLCFLNGGPGENSFLAALDAKTGETVWKTPIAGGRKDGDSKTWTGSWSTPVLWKGEREELLVSYPGRLVSFAPKTGKELWSCGGLGLLSYASPITGEGVAVGMSGYMGSELAVRLGGDGDVTESHRLWHEPRSPQRIGSGVIYEGHIYVLNDPGVAECIELRTGKRVWEERLGGKSWSSMVRSGDRLYVVSKKGECHVIRAAPKFEVLATNLLGERTYASIAVSGGELFIRTYEHLWCIGG